jgi:predicted RecA/RadA family phage recombinase
MTDKFVARGDVMDYVLSGTVSSGDCIPIGHIIGVALADGVDGDTIAVAIEGVFTVPKVSAAVFTQGEKLILDVSATPDAFDDSSATPATGDITGGAIAMVAGANAETTCVVKLTPGNATRT